MNRTLLLIALLLLPVEAFGQGNFQGHGITPRDGYGPVGEKIVFTARAFSAPTTPVTAHTSALATLTPGTWLISWYVGAATAASATMLEAGISTDSSNGTSNIINNDGSLHAVNTNGAPAGSWYFGQDPIYFVATSATPLYAKAISYGATRNATIGGFAVRIK